MTKKQTPTTLARRERFSSNFEVIGQSDKLNEAIKNQILDRLVPEHTGLPTDKKD